MRQKLFRTDDGEVPFLGKPRLIRKDGYWGVLCNEYGAVMASTTQRCNEVPLEVAIVSFRPLFNCSIYVNWKDLQAAMEKTK